jgi:hypothetical protein
MDKATMKALEAIDMSGLEFNFFYGVNDRVYVEIGKDDDLGEGIVLGQRINQFGIKSYEVKMEYPEALKDQIFTVTEDGLDDLV